MRSKFPRQIVGTTLLLLVVMLAASTARGADVGFCPLPDTFPPTDPTDPLVPGDPGDPSDPSDPDTGDPDACSLNGPGMSLRSSPPAIATANPINLLSGNKYKRQDDIAPLPGPLGLAFARHYNSQLRVNYGLGVGWTHSYSTSVQFNPTLPAADVTELRILQADGRLLRFSQADSKANEQRYVSQRPLDGELIRSNRGFRWTWPNGRRFEFDVDGRLTEVREGKHRQLLKRDGGGQLLSVIDSQGRRLAFRWQSGYLAAVTGPGQQTIDYRYSVEGQLLRALGTPIGTLRYQYLSPAGNSYITHIADATGEAYEEYRYDGEGRAVYSARANGIDAVSISYGDAVDGERETVVTNSQGVESRYRIARIGEQERVLEVRGPGCTACSAGDTRYSYNEAGQPLTITDRDGHQIRFEYDALGRQSARYASDPDSAEILLARYSYQGDSSLLASITRPSIAPGQDNTYAIAYDANGQVVQTTETGYAPTTPLTAQQATATTPGFLRIERSTAYRYDADGNVIEVDGPRDDADDLLRLEYDSDNRLSLVTGPDQVPQRILAYDAAGRPSRVQVGEQTPTEFTYDRAGRPTSISRGELSMQFSYDAAGNLISMTDSTGRSGSASYDRANRPTSVQIDGGPATELAYDIESRPTERRVLDARGNVLKQVSYLYDAERRLAGLTNNNATLARYDHDALGVTVSSTEGTATRISSSIGALAPSTLAPATLGGDSENTRGTIQRAPGTLSYTDPRGNTTTQLKDDFGRIVSVRSAEAGDRYYRHDPAGNVVEYQIPASMQNQWQNASRRYDAANRLIEVNRGGATTRFAYEARTGLLALAANDTITERFEYDPEGRLTAHHRELDGHQFTTGYQYNALSQLAAKTLPDGEVLRYHYYATTRAGGAKLRAITRDTFFGFSQRPLIGELDDNRFDGRTGLRFGNGLETSRTFDERGQLATISTTAGLTLNYDYDQFGNITRIRSEAADEFFAYDEIGRLIESSQVRLSARGGASTGKTAASTAAQDAPTERFQEFSYDRAGNRTKAATFDTDMNVVAEQSATYDPASNRLVSINGEPLSYDANGNPLTRPAAKGELTYTYGADNRPVELRIDNKLVARYAYNAFGERVRKTLYSDDVATSVHYFLYDGSELAAEATGDGRVSRHYVHHDGRPVAMLAGGDAYFIQSDHLGTPNTVSDEAGATVWSARYDAFGAARIEREDLRFNLRFPGQYADAESGTHYNYFRDYDPETGRYLTSDPIGIAGGVNTYLYANANPLRFSDPLGLDTASDFVAGLEQMFGHAIDDPDKPGLTDFYRQLVDRQVALAQATQRLNGDPAYAQALYNELRSQGRSHSQGDLLYDAARRGGNAAEFTAWATAQYIFTGEVLNYWVGGVNEESDTTFTSTAYTNGILNRLPGWVRDLLPDSWCLESPAAIIGSDSIMALGLRDPMLLMGVEGIAEYRNLLVGLGLDVGAYLTEDIEAIAREGLTDALGSIPAVAAILAGGNLADALRQLLGEFDRNLPIDRNLRPLAAAINAAVSSQSAVERLLNKVTKVRNVGGRTVVNHGDLGELAVEAVFQVAQSLGLVDEVHTIQNASGQGIDLMVKLNTGEWIALEIKTSRRSRMGRLSSSAPPSQRSGANSFASSRLQRAAAGGPRWTGDPARQALAQRIQREVAANNPGGQISGYVVHITSFHKSGQAVEFREWVPNNARGRVLPNARHP